MMQMMMGMVRSMMKGSKERGEEDHPTLAGSLLGEVARSHHFAA